MLYNDFEIYFVPQRYILFQHLNFQKYSVPLNFLHFWFSKRISCHNGVHVFDISISKRGSEPGIYYIFWFRNVLHTKTVYIFSRSQLPKIIRHGSILMYFVYFDFSVSYYFFSHLYLLSSNCSSSIFFLLLSSSLCLYPALLFICAY
jgi:hypothetical protein